MLQSLIFHLEQRKVLLEQQKTRESRNHCGLVQILQPIYHPKNTFLYSTLNIYSNFYSVPHTVLNSRGTKINRRLSRSSKSSWYSKEMNHFFLKMLYSHVLNFVLKWINVLLLKNLINQFELPFCVCLYFLNLCSGLAQERQPVLIDSTWRKHSIWMESIFPSSLWLFALCPLHISASFLPNCT